LPSLAPAKSSVEKQRQAGIHRKENKTTNQKTRNKPNQNRKTKQMRTFSKRAHVPKSKYKKRDEKRAKYSMRATPNQLSGTYPTGPRVVHTARLLTTRKIQQI
jgi:hypothetical protein